LCRVEYVWLPSNRTLGYYYIEENISVLLEIPNESHTKGLFYFIHTTTSSNLVVI